MQRFRPLVLAALTFLVPPALAAEAKAPAPVIAVQVTGGVSVAHGKAAELSTVIENDALAAGDIVVTEAQASVVLVLPNGSTVTLKEKSRLAITLVLQTPSAAPDPVVYDPAKAEPSTSSTSLELKSGELVASIRKLLQGSDLSVMTAAGQARVKGTEFEIAYTEEPSGEASYRLSNASGLVLFTPVEGKPAALAANQQVEVRGQIGPAGLKLQPVRIRSLPADAKARIQKDNQAAGADVSRALQHAKSLRSGG